MNKDQFISSMESAFKKQVQKDESIKNAYLLVHSEKEGIHLNLAEGETGSIPANPQQPIYMASVGKLFTATIIGILKEQRKLSFDDRIADHLDPELLEGLHHYKDKDYTDEIKISHLLSQTSGLGDNFRPLLDGLMKDTNLSLSPRETIAWVKNNKEPHFPPGQGFKYTDTNYHLLGLIIESITGEPFHTALSKYIFKPLNMRHSHMHGYSEPMEKPELPMADFFYEGTRLNDHKGYGALDYSGGGVVGTTEDLLKFMKALRSYDLVTKDTLDQMKSTGGKLGTGIFSVLSPQI